MPLVPQPLTPAHRLIPSPTGKHGGGNTPGFAGWGTRAWANGTSSGCTESGGRYCCGSFVLWVPISAQLGFSTLDRARGFYMELWKRLGVGSIAGCDLTEIAGLRLRGLSTCLNGF